MRLRRWLLLLMLAPAGAFGQAPDAFSLGLSAVGTRNWDKALGLLESALESDPDNIRYGSEYRQAVIQRATALHPKEGKPEDFDRSLKLFEQLAAQHPAASNLELNYGFAIVDKIPAAGSITQVILANDALSHFTKSIQIKASWIAYYTRGNSYLFWPKIFGRAKLGVADLEEAVKLGKAGPKRPYQARAWVSLGDGYWKIDELSKATAVWTEGLKQYPDDPILKRRLARQGDELKALIEDALDPNKRVDTNLKDLWTNP